MGCSIVISSEGGLRLLSVYGSVNCHKAMFAADIDRSAIDRFMTGRIEFSWSRTYSSDHPLTVGRGLIPALPYDPHRLPARLL